MVTMQHARQQPYLRLLSLPHSLLVAAVRPVVLWELALLLLVPIAKEFRRVTHSDVHLHHLHVHVVTD